MSNLKTTIFFIFIMVALTIALGLSSCESSSEKQGREMSDSLTDRISVISYQEFQSRMRTWIVRDERSSCEFLIARVSSEIAMEKIGCFPR